MVSDVFHFVQALLLKIRVADGEDFIDDENLGLEMRGDGESKTHIHAARIAFHRRVEELIDLRERDDFIEFRHDLTSLHAEDCAVEENVFSPGELGMKSCTDFEQRSGTPIKK